MSAVQKDLKILGETYSRLLLVRCALRGGWALRGAWDDVQKRASEFFLKFICWCASSGFPVTLQSAHGHSIFTLQDVKQLLDADDKDAWPSVSGIGTLICFTLPCFSEPISRTMMPLLMYRLFTQPSNGFARHAEACKGSCGDC